MHSVDRWGAMELAVFLNIMLEIPSGPEAVFCL